MQKLLFIFEGRINRAKWWGASIAVGIVFGIVAGAVVGTLGGPDGQPTTVGGIVLLVFGVVYFWAALALAVKRWHDRNKSGWWVLIALVPVVGGLWYLIECGFLAGTSGPNKYGADPLGTV
jgi:uncharacterized membrane protein YhaH (DUF805 family)